MMVVKSAPSFLVLRVEVAQETADAAVAAQRAHRDRAGRAARDSSKYMSPAWLATAENSSGLRIASTSAPNPPDDLPPIARASRAAIVRKRASIAGITSRTMCVS